MGTLSNSEDLRLCLLSDSGADRSRWREAGLGSLGAHLLLFSALTFFPTSFSRPELRPTQVRKLTPLVLPNFELTQTVPNKHKISKEISAEAVLPRPRVVIPPSAPKRARTVTTPAPPKVQAQRIPEPPLLAQSAPPAMPQLAPPPQLQAEEKPKLAFETPSAPPQATTRNPGLGKIAPPGNSMTEAVRNLAHGSSGGLAVGDATNDSGGIAEGMNLPQLPAKPRSSLELLSDPMGVDFRPYLIRILATVRRNWFAVLPESVKLGRRGKVAIQFAIDREGRVPKLVIVLPSGTDALDRAAVAGVSASNPFPPLPAEFRGAQIRLQFTFVYNMPAN